MLCHYEEPSSEGEVALHVSNLCLSDKYLYLLALGRAAT